MSPLPSPPTGTASPAINAGERGYTLIELLIAMTIGSVVILAAFGLLRFTTSDVSRITARVHVDQRGRLALENIMLELHSACVAPTVVPIREKSSATELRFVSEYSPLNKEEGHPTPTSELSTVRLHRILYTPPTAKIAGTLTEEWWPSSGSPPHYKFNEGETPTKIKLLNGVQAPLNSEGKELPVFKYYRYYHESDHEPVYGQLDLNTGAVPLPLTEKEAKNITKVTIGFTLAPEGGESTTLANDRAVALEDSAIFRLAPASETASESNLPCTTET